MLAKRAGGWRSRYGGDEPPQADPGEPAAARDRGADRRAFGRIRVPHKLRTRGLSISPAAVRGVWHHHGLQTMKKRLKVLEAKVAQEGLILTEAENLVRRALAFLRLASIRLMLRKFCNLRTKLPDSL